MDEVERPRKRTLSKNLSQMKFMKRHAPENTEEEVGGVMTEKWVVPNAPPPVKSSAVGWKRSIESFVECEKLDKFGRFSFNGCNKEIERMAGVHCRSNNPGVLEPEEDADIPAAEVLQRHEAMMSSSNRGERKRKRVKEVFNRTN